MYVKSGRRAAFQNYCSRPMRFGAHTLGGFLGRERWGSGLNPAVPLMRQQPGCAAGTHPDGAGRQALAVLADTRAPMDRRLRPSIGEARSTSVVGCRRGAQGADPLRVSHIVTCNCPDMPAAAACASCRARSWEWCDLVPSEWLARMIGRSAVWRKRCTALSGLRIWRARHLPDPGMRKTAGDRDWFPLVQPPRWRRRLRQAERAAPGQTRYTLVPTGRLPGFFS